MVIPIEVLLLIVENVFWNEFKTIRPTSRIIAELLMPKLLGYKLLHMLAHQRNEYKIVNLLKHHPQIDIGVRTERHMSPLHYAARGVYRKVLCILLADARHRPFMDRLGGCHGSTPLILAARHGCDRSVQLLLNAGARMDVQNSAEECPLYWAITQGQPTMVEILLQHGVDPQQTMRSGFTPLSLAILGRNLELASVLLNHGVDINQHDGRGYTALSWAVISRSLPMARFLLQNGADPSRADDRRQVCRTGHETPLIWAILTRNAAMVRLLVESGADISSGGTTGGKFSPITWAIVLRDVTIAEVLVQNGADIWELDENGQAAFDFAVTSKSKEMLLLLLRRSSILG